MKKLRSMLALFLACVLTASLLSGAFAEGIESAKLEVLRSWVFTAGLSGENEINGFAVADDAVFELYDAETGIFKAIDFDESAIIGTFTALWDNNGDEAADIIRSVSYYDSDKLWDPEMRWIDGAGEADPGIDDETARAVLGGEQVIPYGERLLTGIGIGAWSGTVDYWQNTSNYWTDNDYYNASSSDTLTILTNYRTTLQPTGWTCGLSSLLSTLDWYGLRGSLNAFDLANLRGIDGWAAGTTVEDVDNVLKTLTAMGFIDSYVADYDNDSMKLLDSEWLIGQLEAGHPVMVMWNSFGWHWQTIIGYDTLGTENTNDDVLIMMDPYDTTDGNANGYELESYERLAYGVSLDPTGESACIPTQFYTWYPTNWEYEKTVGDGVTNVANDGVFTDDNKIPYANTADDIAEYYPDTPYLGSTGLAGAATAEVERSGDHTDSPYWPGMDYYNLVPTDSLHILTNFNTIQQSTEWTCGLASALMVMNRFDMAEDESDVSLATHRQNGETGATYLEGMKEVFTYMNDTYGQDWVWVCTDDLDDPDIEESYIGDLCLQAGTDPEWYGLIPYLIDAGIPVMAGSDEWGGHWQVIIGYDDLGTERTEDDVLIFADPYDTTDHNQDGYYVDAFERLVCDWYSSFEPVYKMNDFIAAFPASLYAEVMADLGI